MILEPVRSQGWTKYHRPPIHTHPRVKVRGSEAPLIPKHTIFLRASGPQPLHHPLTPSSSAYGAEASPGQGHGGAAGPFPPTQPSTPQAHLSTYHRGRFGERGRIGCGQRKNWVMLQIGAEFTLRACSAPTWEGSPRPSSKWLQLRWEATLVRQHHSSSLS